VISAGNHKTTREDEQRDVRDVKLSFDDAQISGLIVKRLDRSETASDTSSTGPAVSDAEVDGYEYSYVVSNVSSVMNEALPRTGVRRLCDKCKQIESTDERRALAAAQISSAVKRLDQVWQKCARCSGCAISEVQIANCATSTCFTWGERVAYGNDLLKRHTRGMDLEW